MPIFYDNTMRKQPGCGVSLVHFTEEEATRALAFHKTFPQYAETPLVRLNALSKDLGIGKLLLKDEAKRFNLNAFKVLGCSYAIAQILAERLKRPLASLTRDILCSPEVRNAIGDILFVAATDGNHGRGVAWTAAELGQKAVIFMPEGSAKIRAENIRATGAKCHITEYNYDDTVRHASEYAKKHNGVLVQDTAWEGYEDIPRWIMQGYMTLGMEALAQMRAQGIERPTHLFLQAGVGSFAGAILGCLAATFGGHAPITTILEPHNAACIANSFLAGDGKRRMVSGAMQTIMAGLSCGEPCTTSWGVLRDYATAAISCPDYIAANGMRILAAPLPGDTAVISGESGAVSIGILEYLMTTPKGADIARKLGLGPDSTVLVISTEGDTSPDIYRSIVRHGSYPDPRGCA